MDAPLTAVDVPALVLCGGQGTRLGGSTEKPLVTVCGDPMLDRVVRALRDSRVSSVHAVTSPHAPRTRDRARRLGLDVVDAPGEGYVSDLRHALDVVGTPALTVAADLPFLASDHVDRALSDATRDAAPDDADVRIDSLTVCVPASVKRRLGVSVDTAFEHRGTDVAPTGLNVVGGEGDGTETVSVVDDERLAVNVNRPADREVAESRCD
ncbi:NTP transferase domain-containing protein [Salinigranum sp.]|uniref:NTP transferase domain-containing protein n=1 Tax=Salinigranum sp. TaxID=1966351 RepID=UPI00356982E9